MKLRKGRREEDKKRGDEIEAPENEMESAEAEGEVANEDKAEEAQGGPDDQALNEAAETEEGSRIAALEDQLLRLRAEFANYKRRVEKERNELSTFVKASVYREIFPTLDDFERFFAHVEDRKDTLDDDFVKGIEMIHKSLVSVLERQGIEPISETGVPFDPNFHEAMLTRPVEDEEQDQQVIQVLEVGYRLGNTVIRPARVVVGMYGS